MDRDQIHQFVVEGMANAGYEIIDARVDPRRRICVIIDLEKAAVTIDDCSRASRAIADRLSKAGLDPDAFFLEVRSPGVDRLLTRPKDFTNFAGQRVSVRLREKRDGRRKLVGTLGGIEGEQVMVSLEADGSEWRIPLSEIDEARLAPRF